jgi:hypothetical protein
MRPEEQYKKDIFDRFSDHLSEAGKTHIVTNRKHHFVGFVMPLSETPELVLTKRWIANHDDFNLRTEFLAWVFFYQYAAEAWRISNRPEMMGNIIGLPKHVKSPRRRQGGYSTYYYSTGRPEREFELSLHDSEISKIDAGALKKFTVSVFYGSADHWPVSPWTGTKWSYQWTPKGERHLDNNRNIDRKGNAWGYLTWEQVQAKAHV